MTLFLDLAFFKENSVSFLTRSFHWSVWSLRWTMFHSSFCNKSKLYPQSVRFSTFDSTMKTHFQCDKHPITDLKFEFIPTHKCFKKTVEVKFDSIFEMLSWKSLPLLRPRLRSLPKLIDSESCIVSAINITFILSYWICFETFSTSLFRHIPKPYKTVNLSSSFLTGPLPWFVQTNEQLPPVHSWLPSSCDP